MVALNYHPIHTQTPSERAVTEFLEERLVNGVSRFETRRTVANRITKKDNQLTFHVEPIEKIRESYEGNPDQGVVGICRVIAAATLGTMKAKELIQSGRFMLSPLSGHFIGIVQLEGSNVEYVVDIGRPVPIPILVPINKGWVHTNFYKDRLPMRHKPTWFIASRAAGDDKIQTQCKSQLDTNWDENTFIPIEEGERELSALKKGFYESETGYHEAGFREGVLRKIKRPYEELDPLIKEALRAPRKNVVFTYDRN